MNSRVLFCPILSLRPKLSNSRVFNNVTYYRRAAVYSG